MTSSKARNPVLSGHHPDPSVCRVGEDFYLVTSSFTYFPAIPVHRSRDLVHWERIGSVVDRDGMLPLRGLETSDGIWAPTIRHDGRRFYVTCTVASGRRDWFTFVTTALDPAGPWSDPVPLDATGIDPSLFFDDDGRAWFTAARDARIPGRRAELWMRRFDAERLELTGPEHVLWNGALTGEWVEAPHIVKRDSRYWLIAAEGGTDRNHAVTAASSDSVTGPYVTDPRSPLLTHRHLDPATPVQCVGHADLVDLPDGRTFAVLLATRPIDGTHTLGRETFLTEVVWTSTGPVFGPVSGMLELTFDAPFPPAPVAVSSDRDHFRSGLGMEWSMLRAALGNRVGVGDAGLELSPSPIGPDASDVPSMIVQPQRDVCFRTATRVDLSAAPRGAVGSLIAFQNQRRWAEARTRQDVRGRRFAEFVAFDGVEAALSQVPLPGEGDTVLRIDGDEEVYVFSARRVDSEWQELGRLPRPWFSTEEAGGFVGVHLGLRAWVAVEDDVSAGTVRFAWFDYEGRDRASLH